MATESGEEYDPAADLGDVDLDELLEAGEEIDLTHDEDDLGLHADGPTTAHDYYEDIRHMNTDEACEAVVRIFEEQLNQRKNLLQFLIHEGGLNMIDWWPAGTTAAKWTT